MLAQVIMCPYGSNFNHILSFQSIMSSKLQKVFASWSFLARFQCPSSNYLQVSPIPAPGTARSPPFLKTSCGNGTGTIKKPVNIALMILARKTKFQLTCKSGHKVWKAQETMSVELECELCIPRGCEEKEEIIKQSAHVSRCYTLE